MEIIHLVLGKANPNRMNGVNKVADQLAVHQAQSGHNVSIWGIANDLVANYPSRNYSTKLFQQHKSLWKLDEAIVQAIKDLKNPVVFHLHGAFIPLFYRISKLLVRNRIPYVFTPHGSYSLGALKKNYWVKNLYFRMFEKYIVMKAKAVHLLGKSELDTINDIAFDCNKCLIPNGQSYSDMPSKVWAYDKAVPTFTFCGRIDIRHKGLDLTLKGFRKYLDRGYEGQIELIGDGGDMDELKQLIYELKLENKITLHGFQTGRSKYDLLCRGDFFFHFSRMEGFPTAVLEAAALGLPLLVSEETNVIEYVKAYDAGYTINENTPSRIADTFELAHQAFQNKQAAVMGHGALEMVRKAFDWNTISQQLVDVYQS